MLVNSSPTRDDFEVELIKDLVTEVGCLIQNVHVAFYEKNVPGDFMPAAFHLPVPARRRQAILHLSHIFSRCQLLVTYHR